MISLVCAHVKRETKGGIMHLQTILGNNNRKASQKPSTSLRRVYPALLTATLFPLCKMAM